ncbi:O-antigen ligase family protein [Brachybacterium massiliense]|uniref:O-antigen ligase family protein n=1 Tax=Brachybacterium massiliense TaxID=1755098 RepID=UPI000B3BCF94|nr:O-antigen ligase family protein [Brachybacterium massiliense]
MIPAFAAAAFVSSWWIVFSRPNVVVSRALVIAIGWLTVIPLNGASSMAIAIGLAAAGGALLVAWNHGHHHSEGTLVLVLGIGLLGLIFLANLLSGITGPIRVLTLAVLVLLAATASRMRYRDLPRFTEGLAVIVVLHLAYAMGEVWAGLPGLWPMSDGTNDISDRVNTILPTLAGRPMTSFSHPIPFSFFLAAAGAIGGGVAVRTGKLVYWLIPLLTTAGVLMSGTRSAVLAAAGVIVFQVLIGYRKNLVARLFGVGALAGIIGWRVGYDTLRGLLGFGGEFETSDSYEHRTAVLSSFPDLFRADLIHVLFGWGTDLQYIFDSGVVDRHSTSFYFFDNQFVATMAQEGLLGLLMLLGVLVLVLIYGDSTARSLGVLMITMALSFDVLDHIMSQSMLILAVGLTAAEMNRRRVAERHRASRPDGAEPYPERGGAEHPSHAEPTASEADPVQAVTPAPGTPSAAEGATGHPVREQGRRRRRAAPGEEPISWAEELEEIFGGKPVPTAPAKAAAAGRKRGESPRR